VAIAISTKNSCGPCSLSTDSMHSCPTFTPFVQSSPPAHRHHKISLWECSWKSKPIKPHLTLQKFTVTCLMNYSQHFEVPQPCRVGWIWQRQSTHKPCRNFFFNVQAPTLELQPVLKSNLKTPEKAITMCSCTHNTKMSPCCQALGDWFITTHHVHTSGLPSKE
jgi:hypothetical protein